jgi:hypothetical protein
MPLPIAAADAGAGNANATPSPNKAANTIVFILLPPFYRRSRRGSE